MTPDSFRDTYNGAPLSEEDLAETAVAKVQAGTGLRRAALRYLGALTEWREACAEVGLELG